LSWSGVREGEEENEDSGWDIYRWLLDTKAVEDDEEIAGLLKRNTRSTFVVPHEEKTLRLVWYQCRK
jgi:salicylate hydroxylase